MSQSMPASMPPPLPDRITQTGRQASRRGATKTQTKTRKGSSRDSVIYTIPPDPYFLAHTRGFVRGTLHHWKVPETVLDNAEAIVSELATNAMVHTKAPARLRLSRGEPLRIEVADASPTPPTPAVATLLDGRSNGLGLLIVEVFADRWGHHRTATGKNVWCELRTTNSDQ